MKGNIKQGQELEALINQITSIPMTVAIKEEDLDYLHQAKAILKRRIHSFPWRKRSIPTHSEWLYPLTFDAGKGLKEA